MISNPPDIEYYQITLPKSQWNFRITVQSEIVINTRLKRKKILGKSILFVKDWVKIKKGTITKL